MAHGNLATLRPGWRPGQSGNPSGHPRQVLAFAEYIAEQTDGGREVCDLMLAAMRDPDAFAARASETPFDGGRWKELSPADRAKVRQWAIGGLLDRFLGRAVQTIKIDKGPAKTFDASKLTDAQLAALREALAAGVAGE